MLKKIALAISPVVALFWAACSSNDADDIAGGTIDPNTIAENSSSSKDNLDVTSSSSSQNAETISSSSVRSDDSDYSSSSTRGTNIRPESSSDGDSKNINVSSSSEYPDIVSESSSSEFADNSSLLVTDVSIQCMISKEDSLLESSRDDIDYPLPEAFRYVSTERTGFTIKWLELTAGVEAKTFDVSVFGDTVYVSAMFDYSNAQRHKCLSQIDFAVDNDAAVIHATLLNFQNSSDSSSSGVLRIIDMDVIPE